LRRPARHGALIHALACVARTFAWPFVAFAVAIRHCPGEPRRAFKAWTLAVRRNVPPVETLLYGLDQPGRAAAAGDYLYWTDLPSLTLLNAARGAEIAHVQDKYLFAQRCGAAGLPVVPTLAVFSGRRQLYPEAGFVPDLRSFWVKDLAGKGASGAAAWERGPDNVYRNCHGSSARREGLAALLAEQNCIVQPRLENHPAIPGTGAACLAALRIVTGVGSGGRARLVGSNLYLGSRGRSTSGDIVCNVHRSTGTLTGALDLRLGAIPIDSHPETLEPLIGLDVPFWRDSLDLVLAAHADLFGKFVFLGWDVAMTPAGPILLEANAGWTALHLQMLDGPLGRTAFGAIVAEVLGGSSEGQEGTSTCA
jgi:hypothetical protein